MDGNVKAQIQKYLVESGNYEKYDSIVRKDVFTD